MAASRGGNPRFYAKVDAKHRVVIPKSAVEALEITPGTRVVVSIHLEEPSDAKKGGK